MTTLAAYLEWLLLVRKIRRLLEGIKLDDKKVLLNLLKSSKEDLDFFSNPGKPERERWVVSELLQLLGVAFEDFELKSLEQKSKIDVAFRDARFQVKELMDPGYLRTKIIRETYNSIKVAEILEQITYPSIGHDIPPIAKI
jgi:hypothetical protein